MSWRLKTCNCTCKLLSHLCAACVHAVLFLTILSGNALGVSRYQGSMKEACSIKSTSATFTSSR